MVFAVRPGAPAPVAAALVRHEDGREAMAFVFDCAAWSQSCRVLARLAIAWMLEPRPAPAAGGGSASSGGAAASGGSGGVTSDGGSGATTGANSGATASDGGGSAVTSSGSGGGSISVTALPLDPSLIVPSGNSGAVVAAGCSSASATLAACQAAATATGATAPKIIADLISQITSLPAQQGGAAGRLPCVARGAWAAALGALMLVAVVAP
jgi:hypothetical protein